MTAINNAGIDQNNKPTLIGVSSVDGSTPTRVYVNPTTGRMLVDNANTSGTITYKNGIATRAGNTASGAQTIAHGLGKTPSYVRLTGTFSGSGSGETGMSIGSYNGTTNCNTYISTGSNGSQSGSDTTNAIFITNNGGASSQAGVVTVDGTNITITWTYAATQDSALMRIMWEAQG